MLLLVCILCDNWFSGAWYECVWVFCNIAVNCDYSLWLTANQAKCFQTATTSYLSQSDLGCCLVRRCIRGRNCTYCKGCYFGFPRKNNPKRKEKQDYISLCVEKTEDGWVRGQEKEREWGRRKTEIGGDKGRIKDWVRGRDKRRERENGSNSLNLSPDLWVKNYNQSPRGMSDFLTTLINWGECDCTVRLSVSVLMRKELLSEPATPEPPGHISVKTHNHPSTISLIKEQTAFPATLAIYLQIDTARQNTYTKTNERNRSNKYGK